MQHIQLWPTDARIIEIGPTSGAFGAWLLASGCRKYLGIVRSEEQRRRLVEQHPTLATCVVVSRSKRIVRQNNADVLILHGASVQSLLHFRNVRHARQVACELRLSLACAAAILFGMWQWLLRRFAWPVIVFPGDGSQRFVVFAVRQRRSQAGARRYLPHSLGVAEFLKRLNREGVRHAVLRWFETLPELPPGEDLDLLVDDASLNAVRAMLEEGPGVQPVDLYSVTGLPGADFRRMPYYPPYLAEQLLERAVDHRGLCRVPAPREHFLSLAYHALYHKGAASGLASAEMMPAAKRVDHDYASILQRLAVRLGIDVPITLDGLDAYLDSESWRPPHDMLVRLARHNRWVRSRLKKPADAQTDHRVAVFLLRSVALERGGIERASELLDQHGFQVLAARQFESALATTIARSVRGGNWGRGPWPHSGGVPVAAIVAYDPAPIVPNRRQKRRFPFLANARLLVKEQIRDAFNDGYPSEQHCNVIHSSDNGREALDYLRIIGPEFADEVLAKMHELQSRSTSLPSSLSKGVISKRSAA